MFVMSNMRDQDLFLDHDSVLCSRIEEEKQKSRREWQRQQELIRQHEKLKQQKILEYERKRAQALGYPEPKPLHCSRSSSKSPLHYRHRGRSMTNTSKSDTLFEKLDGSASGTVHFFKGPEGTQISTTELRRIKVNIQNIDSRNIPIKGPILELQQSTDNTKDVVLKRRKGEGTKPIFDREEIKKKEKHEWQRQQELERLHEKLKQQILKYERKRAQILGYPEPKSSHCSQSKSSMSPSHYRHRERSMTSTTSKSDTLFEKLDGSTSGTVSLSKCSEGIPISLEHQTKVHLRRNISIPEVNGLIPVLKRSIVNAENVVFKRREGEGTKPIFDREEIKRNAEINELEERHMVADIDGEQSVSTSKLQTSKKRSSSLSSMYNFGYLFSQSSNFRETMDKSKIHVIFEYEFRRGTNAAQTARNINEVFATGDLRSRWIMMLKAVVEVDTSQT